MQSLEDFHLKRWEIFVLDNINIPFSGKQDIQGQFFLVPVLIILIQAPTFK